MTGRATVLCSIQAQIRQQMSTRAEVLNEERKKAEASLEGLKNKLKNLEEVQVMISSRLHFMKQIYILRARSFGINPE